MMISPSEFPNYFFMKRIYASPDGEEAFHATVYGTDKHGGIKYVRDDFKKDYFKFKPQQHVKILPFHEGAVYGRISRCINDGGQQPIYLVNFIMNGDTRAAEFLEDELELKGREVPF